jgi:hypothetical protein
MINIAGARQIFYKNFFFSFLQGKLPQEVKKKNFILKNLRGDCNNTKLNASTHDYNNLLS